ncbi:MAG TPA: AAA family ATPase [Acetobacteraceae bacterium]|nr:AAA family ATPase [Acetobacteraceae bacterium]
MDQSLDVLWSDGERVLVSGSRLGAEGERRPVLTVRLAADRPSPLALERLAHEYEIRNELDSAWAARPLEFAREDGRAMLVLEHQGGELLARLLGGPMETGAFLHLAIGITTALGKAHQAGLVHKDLKPGNILVNCADGAARLTGFGIATRLPRERQTLVPPETIAGTLAYMAPEQTGRMNRSIDSRSDLYSLGVIFYQMLTGVLPYTASDPMEWVLCHVARKPAFPGDRAQIVPPLIALIVMKLLAKAAEERYQSAAGLERDLRRCLIDWEDHGRIEDFPLGQHDTPDRLLIPETLYGRAREVAILLAAFQGIAQGGAPELVLISGYSGIGKSAVVNELHKVLVPLNGLFASGKFDQYKRDIPYSTLAQAFQGLVRPLLAKSEGELTALRGAFLQALAPNARLITDLIPELKLIIGEQPPVLELEPRQAQSRFQLVFQRFIGVFARAEHPLALFFDDLQWLDTATLDFLENLLTGSDLQHLMLIGAYRDNEVGAAHPLMRKLDAIRQAGAQVREIRLQPLARDDLNQLIADALRCESRRSAPLAQLVQEKTAGNPFFVIQFLHALAEEGLLAFDHDASHWRWDLERIHAKSYTDNVVDLLAGKIGRLQVETQRTLQQMAHLGNAAEIPMLSIALQIPEEQIDTALWPAVRQELVERLDGSYKFVHDRVQEAAYSLTPDTLRAEVHLRIGRLLAVQTPPEKQEAVIFEIVNQMNRGAALITSRDEREQLAQLNMIAAKRAKDSTAYDAALTYLGLGATLLTEDTWQRRRELTFALELNRAECEFLTGHLSVAEERLAALSNRATTTIERAVVACLRMDVCTTLDQSNRAVAVCLDYLRHVGIAWSPHPAEADVRHEYERIWAMLGSRNIEDIIDLPSMDDPASLATADVLSKLVPPASHTDANLACLTSCKAASLSLERGICDASCVAFVMLARVAGPMFDDCQAGFRFGQVGYELVERRGLKRFEAGTYLNYAIYVVRWTQHVRVSRDLMRRAFEAANRIGDLTYGAYSCENLNSDLIFAGEPLPDVQAEAERGLAFAEKARFGLVIDFIAAQLALIRMLRGLTPAFGCLDHGQFNERHTEHILSSASALAIAPSWYWIRKLQARCIAGDYATAMDAASKVQRLLWTTSGHIEEADYHFYGALTQAAVCNSAPPDERQQYIDAVRAHYWQHETWAKNCPENFDNRAALVAAELARIEGRELDAERLYEQAIQSARDNGFVHNEAIAYERAAEFYRARGFRQIADLYLRNARYGYLRWGADGKVQQLEAMYPYLRVEGSAAGPTNTIATSVEGLDLATVIKVSQTISSEMVLEKLLDTLMRTAIVQAAAERGVLVLSQGKEPRIAAEATIASDTVLVELRDAPVTSSTLPTTMLHYVLRTRECVVLDEALSDPSFAADPYIRQHRARSILCLPLINQAKLIGVLYLENNLTARAFAPARLAALKILASQAAVALENTRLYRDGIEREARIRRLVDANIIGIFIWEFEGRIVEANDAFLRIVGHDREDLVSGRLRWTDLTPPEWHMHHEQLWTPEIRLTGSVQPYEKEYFRKDGSRAPVLIGAASFDETGNQGVSFVLDLTERKRAEGEARDSERRYREVATELARANRVATMGQLTASIAHEVKQPITATTTNAAAALRWLGAQPANLEEARRTLHRIINDATRASSIIDRIRDLTKKAPAHRGSVDINEAIREVIALTRGEAVKTGVSVRTQLAEGLPLIDGDRVQLQQVNLNLIINAIEAMSGTTETPRELLISTALAEPGGVLVAVGDSGPGLAPSALEQLFEAFYTTKPNGLGLGLSICRSIIEAHGGRLWATANTPRGAVFHFEVPGQPAGP